MSDDFEKDKRFAMRWYMGIAIVVGIVLAWALDRLGGDDDKGGEEEPPKPPPVPPSAEVRKHAAKEAARDRMKRLNAERAERKAKHLAKAKPPPVDAPPSETPA